MTFSSSSEQREPFSPDAPVVFAFCDPAPNDAVAQLIAHTLPGSQLVVVNQGAGDAAHSSAIGDGLCDIRALAASVEDLAHAIGNRRRLYPRQAVYGIGYATGATQLAALLVKYPDLFERTALLHPLVSWVPPGNAELQGKRILVTGGQDDPARPLALTEQLVDYLAGQKADVRALYIRGGHEIGQEELMALRDFLQAPRD
ncbi:putative esterase [Ensifer sp. KUDG1]|uniref:alpha/beta hydrolase n=1 Tax=Ensifer sp. KUDG1 TaxID=3373919 RepID=UPI003D1CA031